MTVRLLPWQPEYGTSMQFDADDDSAGDPPDIAVERDVWAPVTPDPAALPAGRAVQIVDGVRRAEAHAMDDAPDGTPVFGLFGSFAVGAVRCEPRGARILDPVSVERRFFHTGEAAEDLPIECGRARLVFRASAVRHEATANALVARLNQEMLDAEARLAEELSGDERPLTLVDGPLRSLRSPGRRIVGYVKRVQRWYVSQREIELLQVLRRGERTPIFEIPPASQDPAREGRFSWFLRVAELAPHLHPLGGVMRLETRTALGLSGAIRMADETALILPRLAGVPGRDPRAPQNLTPVAALEARLTHLLGDRLFIRRQLGAALAGPARREV